MRHNFQCEPPPLGWSKGNFDSSFKQESEVSGLGWIVQDYRGGYITAGMSKITWVRSVLETEALGFLNAIRQVLLKEWRSVCFEGDNSILCGTIYKNEVNVEIGNFLLDINHWAAKLQECSLLGHVKRQRNHEADLLSKKNLHVNVSSVFYDMLPNWLIHYLYHN